MTDAATNSATEPTRVMVIAAHPDDPEFGCAATMAKWAKQGKEIKTIAPLP